MPRKGTKGKKIELKAKMTYHFNDDQIGYDQLMKVMAMAADIADMSPEDAKKYQDALWRK